MISAHSSYRTYLQAILAKRIRANRRYSLRAYARQLGLGSSTLCEIMKGKGNLSVDSAQKIAARLELDAADAEFFCLLVQLERAKSAEAKESVLNQLNRLRPRENIHNLSVDQFNVIADWYHVAILELTYVEGFDFNSREISKWLGISRAEAQAAMGRLIRLGLVEKRADGKFTKTSDYFQVNSQVPNEAIRRFYKQTLQKTITAVESQSPDEKLSGCETLPIDPGKLPEARQILERFFSEMIHLSKSSRRKTKVYHLGVHFFDLTAKGNK